MRLVKTHVRTLVGALLVLTGSVSAWAECGDTGVALQILGSGGPFGVGRASAGYIVWIDGVSRIMVDAGGGTFAHFHEAGAKIADLQLLALSHFHPDHSSEVPALLWPRGATLRVAGPSGSTGFPSLDDFLGGLFGPDGVFQVMNSRVTFDTVTVNAAAPEPMDVLREGRVRVRGLGVPHGSVPAIGYRVDVGDASIVFSSDQNGSNPAFTELSRDADVLVVHFAGSEKSAGRNAALHAKPSVWGQIATDAGVGALVLSHLSANQDFEESLAHLRSRYSGPLTVAEDLLCVAVE
ncbi:MAG: MBL fold metallo-hydrolase [Nitrospirae bacterium]|nr:MBL fold metallo-hydrolase [Nitrospirota bacterium]